MIYLAFKASRRKEYVSPSVLFCSGFAISTLFSTLNVYNWNYSISPNTVFIILLSVLVFGFGCRLGNRISIRTEKKWINYNKNWSVRTNSLLFFLGLIVLLCCGVRIFDIIQTTKSSNLFSGAIALYRYNSAPSKITNIIKICDALVSSILIFVIIDIAKKNSHTKYTHYILLVIGIIYYALSSSRIEIIYVFIYGIVAYLIELKVKNSKLNIHSIMLALKIGLLLLLIFFAAGFLTGKSQAQKSMFDNISLYAGSSIDAFDIWLNRVKHVGNYYGSITLIGISNLLSLLGVNIQVAGDPTLTYINIGNMLHTTNVYTCLAEYISDVGFAGSYIIIMILGMISQIIYRKALISRIMGKQKYYALYIYMAPIILLSSIAERFFSTFFTLSTIVFMICIKLLLSLQYKSEAKAYELYIL